MMISEREWRWHAVGKDRATDFFFSLSFVCLTMRIQIFCPSENSIHCMQAQTHFLRCLLGNRQKTCGRSGRGRRDWTTTKYDRLIYCITS